MLEEGFGISANGGIFVYQVQGFEFYLQSKLFHKQSFIIKMHIESKEIVHG